MQLAFRLLPVSIVALVVLLAPGVKAEDWPQWMGPTRDNRWTGKNIVREFPADGLDVVWRAPVGGGYAGPSVADGRVFVFDFVTDSDVKVSNFEREPSPGTERILCLDAVSGKQLWKVEYPVTYTISYPAGPRCTPLVEDGRVIALGAEGNLHCLDAKTGEVIWKRDLKQDYETKAALWGYANHPLIDGNKLICIVGGTGTHAVAFDKLSGKELWRYGTAAEQGYSPPTIIEAGGKRQLILMSPESIASVDPENGKPYWTEDYEATSGSIIMTPVVFENYLFVGGYSNRNLMLELNTQTPTVKRLFRDKAKHGISPVNVQPFLEGNMLYGLDGDGSLTAVELPSGKRVWETAKPLADRPLQTGTAFIVQHEDRYFLFAETGELLIAKLTPAGFEELDRTKIIEPTNNAFGRPVVWCAPAYANGCIVVRNDSECICVDLKAH